MMVTLDEDEVVALGSTFMTMEGWNELVEADTGPV